MNGIGTTEENLISAAKGEMYEYTDMYKTFAEEAREEGFEDIALLFEKVGEIERDHHERYEALLKNIREGKVFKKDSVVVWKCANCGHIHVALEAPDVCPVCSHSQSYFQVEIKNY